MNLFVLTNTSRFKKLGFIEEPGIYRIDSEAAIKARRASLILVDRVWLTKQTKRHIKLRFALVWAASAESKNIILDVVDYTR